VGKTCADHDHLDVYRGIAASDNGVGGQGAAGGIDQVTNEENKGIPPHIVIAIIVGVMLGMLIARMIR